jgi:hypothetical protein
MKTTKKKKPVKHNARTWPKGWPLYYQRLAQNQGWDIFDSAGSEDGRWQLCAIAVPTDHPHLRYTEPKFKDATGQVSDTAAAEHVKALANRGSKLAIAAINFLISRRSRDVAKFKLRDAIERT